MHIIITWFSLQVANVDVQQCKLRPVQYSRNRNETFSFQSGSPILNKFLHTLQSVQASNYPVICDDSVAGRLNQAFFFNRAACKRARNHNRLVPACPLGAIGRRTRTFHAPPPGAATPRRAVWRSVPPCSNSAAGARAVELAPRRAPATPPPEERRPPAP